VRGALMATELEKVAAPFANAAPFPARAYFDAEQFEAERAAIFERAFVVVGREDEVDTPETWISAEIAGQNVICARGVDLELRAFRNVCRHRGAELVAGRCGRARAFTCPYHGWTYGLDGALRDAPFAPDGFDRNAHGLFGLRVERWQGFVFASADANAPKLSDFFGEVPPWLVENDLASLRRMHRSSWEIAANWKLCVENFQESHHFARVHPALEALTPTRSARSWLGNGRWLGGTMEIEDAETVSTSGARRDRPLLVSKANAARVHDAMLFPFLFTSLQPDYLLTYRLDPLCVDRTRVTFDVLVHPEAKDDYDREILDFWARVNVEDRAICERQQVGMKTPGFVSACYATVEEGVHAFDRLVARALVETR
jgi:Rieske 2Fe-2S family protein